MTKRTNPGDVANLFVRCLLSDIGDALGGFSGEDWEKTLQYFDYRCAYTGKLIDRNNAVIDHVISHNKEFCGLHMLGNIVPATREANSAKGSQNYVEYILNDTHCLGNIEVSERERRIAKIEEFMKMSGYLEKTNQLENLTLYCNSQYEIIKNLCYVNKNYFNQLLRVSDNQTTTSNASREVTDNMAASHGTLQIDFEINPIYEFHKRLMQTRIAYITEYYSDGSVKVKDWKANNISASSNIIGNLRSKTNYRNLVYKELGIRKLYVSISKPATD